MQTERWKRTALLIPLLAVLGVLGLFAYGAADDAHVRNEWAVCHDLPVSREMYGAAYGALACEVGALLLLWWLFRRGGVRSWQGTTALVCGLLAVLPLFFQVVVVLSLYQPAPGGPITCTG
ncbi:hypothetical protein ACWCP6_23690 [Streptomyces sp. NPDC002004]